VTTAYCLICKDVTDVVDSSVDYYKNGTPVIKGKCIKCGKRITRIMKRDERVLLKEKQYSSIRKEIEDA